MAADTYLIITFAVLVGWIAWLVYRRAQRTIGFERERMAAISRVAEKFPTSDEFLSFLRSKEATTLFGTSGQRAAVIAGGLRFLQIGAVALVLGLSLLWSAHTLRHLSDAHSMQQMDERSYWGTALIGLGGGLSLAGVISFVAARKLDSADAASRD